MRRTVGKPVHVSFELLQLGPNDEFGREELSSAIAACEESAAIAKDAKAVTALEAARQMLSRRKVPCLRVSDRDTTGLRGAQWRALVKQQGLSAKEGEGAGGSHGIGKYAPFVVSALRTVFYWTCYEEDGQPVERFQGKSVLMSHKGEAGTTQGTGFYGIKKECLELTGTAVPRRFRLLNATGKPVYGTSLEIAGFSATGDWRRRIAASVIENFFHAISSGKLTVTIDPDEALSDRDLLEITGDSLGDWFNYLKGDSNGDDSGDEDGSALTQAREFWELSAGNVQPVEKQDHELGHCRLWIRVAEGLPSRVAFVRSTGMLVTTQQRNLLRFPMFRSFTALCVFEDPKGNELLRQMENPKQDQFEPERLQEADRERGRRALKRITDWIRSEVRKVAGPPEGGATTVLLELAAYLPDTHPDLEQFEDADLNGDGHREPGFGDRVQITLKPIRRTGPRVLLEDDPPDGEGDGDGDDIGNKGGAGTGDGNDGGGNGIGPGDGDGQGGAGTRGGDRARKTLPISNLRILPIQQDENRYQLSFRAGGSGVVRLELAEAGDSSSIPRSDIRAVSSGDGPSSLDKVLLTAGERVELEITADEPIGGRAWRLSAVEASQK